MVAPLVIGGLMAASAAANYLGNEQARNASNKAMREAAKMRDDSKGYLDQIDPAQIEALNQAYLKSLVNEGQGLNYDPEMYDFIATPQYMQNTYLGDVQANQVNDSQLMKLAQLAGLAQLESQANNGLDAKSKAEFMRAQRAAGEFAKGREGAIMNDMQARGMGGSGLEFAMRQIAGQQGGDSLSQAMADQAAADANQRLQAQMLALESAGQIRGQDVNTSAMNAEILNNMALTNSARRQEIANMNTDLANERINNNIDEQRRISGLNTTTANQAQIQNNNYQQLRNQSLNQNLMSQYAGGQNLYNAQSDKQRMLANATLGGVSDAYAKGAANADYERGKYGAIASVPSAIGNYYANKEDDEDEKK